MNLTLKILLFLNVILCSCEPTTNYHSFYQTYNFTQVEIDIMQSGADEWCEISNGIACAYFNVYPSDSSISLVPVNLTKPNQLGHHLGKPFEKSIITIIDHREQDNWYQNLYNLTIHELGHHWGCEHTNDTIMSKFYDFEVSTIEIDKLTSCDFSIN